MSTPVLARALLFALDRPRFLSLPAAAFSIARFIDFEEEFIASPRMCMLEAVRCFGNMIAKGAQIVDRWPRLQ